jgi:FixJ family two-component response regulator
MRKIYEVGIDLGELGTQTIATFDDMALAMAFLDGYKLADATSNVFIDTATSDFLESVFKDTELNGMLEALQYAMYKLETLYNNEERRNRIEQTLQQLTKIETLLIEHLP